MIEVRYDDGDIMFFKNIKNVRYNYKENYLCIFGTDDGILWGGVVEVCCFGYYRNNVNTTGKTMDDLCNIDKIMFSMMDDYCLIVNAKRTDYLGKSMKDNNAD